VKERGEAKVCLAPCHQGGGQCGSGSGKDNRTTYLCTLIPGTEKGRGAGEGQRRDSTRGKGTALPNVLDEEQRSDRKSNETARLGYEEAESSGERSLKPGREVRKYIEKRGIIEESEKLLLDVNRHAVGVWGGS